MNANVLSELVTGEKRANLAQENKYIYIQIAGLTIKLEHFIDRVKGTVANLRKSLKIP